jgi:hypothetical protein
MKLLKWADKIKEPNPVTKEDILNKAEKAEIIYLAMGSLYGFFAAFGIFLMLIAQSGSIAFYMAILTIIFSIVAQLELKIKSYPKLERYKALWDQIDRMQTEERKMQAQDL